MLSTRWVILGLRLLLVLLFLGLVVAQTLIVPGSVAYRASENPDFAQSRWLVLAFCVIELLCVQLVIVAIWRLLSLVTRDRIFDESAFRWVDVILGSMAVAWLLLAAVFVYVCSIADDPGVLVLMFGMLLVGAVLIFLMLVMRALLRQATTLRVDMEAVI